MVKKVLPPLNEQNQIPNISTSGEWKVEDSTFLEKLAKGLKMGGEEVVSASEIVSVPDVWARVLIVRNGLLDNRSSVVNEWRGTLALLALAPYYSHVYKLSSDIVNIQDIKNNPFTGSASPQNAGYSHIGKILFDVKPQDTMAQGQDWNAIGVLNFNKAAIAVINPYTMVAAARDYTHIKDISKLPWYDDGYLIDPCNARDMRREQYAVLSHYIQNLITGIQSLGYSNMEVFNAMMGRLQEFKKSCDAKSSGISFALGYIGGILILIVCIKIFIDNDSLPFGLEKENFENVRATSIVVGFWYLLFSMPFLLSLKKEYKNKIDENSNSIKKIKNLVWNIGLNNLGKFLLARMLYADGLNAIIVMGGIFAVGVYNLEIKDLLVLSILMNITAFIGAIIGGYANDKFTSKSVIIFSLIGLIVSSAIILFIKTKIFFLIFASINGFFIGPVQSASRVFITKSIDKNNQASGFGLFALSGKLTSFIGPLLVSTVTFISNSQRIGFSSAIFLLLLGLTILINVKKI